MSVPPENSTPARSPGVTKSTRLPTIRTMDTGRKILERRRNMRVGEAYTFRLCQPRVLEDTDDRKDMEEPKGLCHPYLSSLSYHSCPSFCHSSRRFAPRCRRTKR